MSLKKRFQNPDYKNKALAKIKWVWADTEQSFTCYSLPSDDKWGLDNAVKALIRRFNTINYRLRVKDDRMFIYDNQKQGVTHEEGLLAEIRGGVRV